MNKKLKTQHTVLFYFTTHIAMYLDSLNTCREVSKDFIPLDASKKITMKTHNIASRSIRNLLLKRNDRISFLDLSDCVNLNDRDLVRLMSHFHSLKTLLLDGCHTLSTVPVYHKQLNVSVSDLWRIFKAEDKLPIKCVMNVILNAYNYIQTHCHCHCNSNKNCIRKIKEFCLFPNGSILIYILDSLLDTVGTSVMFMESMNTVNTDTVQLNLCFNGFYRSVHMQWTMKSFNGKWLLVNIWKL